jgi:hypothetical protein
MEAERRSIKGQAEQAESQRLKKAWAAAKTLATKQEIANGIKAFEAAIELREATRRNKDENMMEAEEKREDEDEALEAEEARMPTFHLDPPAPPRSPYSRPTQTSPSSQNISSVKRIPKRKQQFYSDELGNGADDDCAAREKLRLVCQMLALFGEVYGEEKMREWGGGWVPGKKVKVKVKAKARKRTQKKKAGKK